MDGGRLSSCREGNRIGVGGSASEKDARDEASGVTYIKKSVMIVPVAMSIVTSEVRRVIGRRPVPRCFLKEPSGNFPAAHLGVDRWEQQQFVVV